MHLEEHVYSVMVVSSSDNLNTSLTSLLPFSSFHPVHIEKNMTKAKRILLDRHYDFIIVNSLINDEASLRFCIDMSLSKNTVALLLVKAEVYHEMFDKASHYGVYVLPKPLSRSLMTQAIDWMVTTKEKLNTFEKKNISIEEKMLEIRIINRAKIILIEKMNYTENEAHKYIEKQAMNQSLTKKEVALNIIKHYTNEIKDIS